MDRFGLVGTVLEGRYRVEQVVAEGGFGVVYRGVHCELETALAIKVLKTPTNLGEAATREFVQKFRLEAKTMARFRHPNIVLVQDTGVSRMPSGEQAPWMALEWLEGETLRDFFKVQGPMSPVQALDLLRPVMDALAFAHDERVAHRDVKPENIFLVQGKRGRLVKLLDFGIAKLLGADESAGTGETQTQTTLSAFSPMYAAPEQLTNSRTGPWTDVHAMGLVFTQALVGQPPYSSEEKNALFQEILSPVRPTPAKHGLDVGSWEGVLLRAMAFRPDERYPGAGEFLADLASLVHGVTVNWSSSAPRQHSSVPPDLQSRPGGPVAGQTGPGAETLRAVTSERATNSPRGSRLLRGAGALVALGGLLGLGVWLGRSSRTSDPSAKPAVVTAPPAVAPPPTAQAVSDRRPSQTLAPTVKPHTPEAPVAETTTPRTAQPPIAPGAPTIADAGPHDVSLTARAPSAPTPARPTVPASQQAGAAQRPARTHSTPSTTVHRGNNGASNL